MTPTINLRHLEDRTMPLSGEATPAELELESGDEMIRLNQPLKYDLQVQQMEQAILVQGVLELPMDCECVRCLRRFHQVLRLDDWACHIPLEGEEKALIINDCVSLTPYLREDIFLAFPQHPLCDADCRGLKTSKINAETGRSAGETEKARGAESAEEASPWSALDKLKL